MSTKHKIGVIAGTPVDTQMGVDFITAKGEYAIGQYCSKTPEEQSILQVLHKPELAELFIQISNALIQQGAESIFVYCNSLSAALDLNYVRSKIPAKVVTPLEVYERCADKYSKLSIIAANGQSLAKIENIVMSKNENCIPHGAASLEIVKRIEAKEDPGKIYDNLCLKGMLDSFVAMGSEALILGCTHFPYILAEIEKDISIPIINPSEVMFQMLFE